MAYEKQNWKDALQAAKSKGSGSDDQFDQRSKKKEARVMYTRRILEREVKQYLKSKKGAIRYRDIDKIGRRHGFYIT